MNDTLTDEFVVEFFKCALTDKNFTETAMVHVLDQYFSDESHRLIWKEIKRQFRADKKLPTIGVLKLQFRNNIDVKSVLNDVREVVAVNIDSVLKNLEEFILQNKFVVYYNKLGDLYNQKQRDKAYKLFIESAKEFSEFGLRQASFEKIFKGFSERQIERATKDRRKERIPLGIDPLDDLMGGGVEPGEFTLFLGDSGHGKSILLIGAGIAAARLGYRVAHFQAEGTREQCMDRYDSAWTGSLYKDIKGGDIDPNTLKKAKKTIQDIRGEVFVRSFEQFNTASINDIRNSLIELIKAHGHIARVVIDYLELFDPSDGKSYSPSEERFRQTSVARQLKNLAVEFRCDVVTVTQSTAIDPKSFKNDEFKITRYHLSEDKGKIRPLDNFITINQTPDERMDHVVRLYCDKFREHDSGQTLPIKQNLARTRFFDRKETANYIIELGGDV